MSIYSEKIAKLKREISIISSKKSSKKKSKRFNKNQKIMIDYINGVTKKAEFDIMGHKITLFNGDDKKGFKHIIEKHYNPKGLETMDILNIMSIFERGLKLNNEGVSNKELTVYMSLNNGKELRLVLCEVQKGTFVVTLYRKS